MKITIKDQKLYMNGKYYCDSKEPSVPKGKYNIAFVHTNRFNSMMPVINVPGYKDIMFCWCWEKCNREINCEFCDAIQLGKINSSGELSEGRKKFNYFYNYIRHPAKEDKEIVLEIN